MSNCGSCGGCGSKKAAPTQCDKECWKCNNDKCAHNVGYKAYEKDKCSGCKDCKCKDKKEKCECDLDTIMNRGCICGHVSKCKGCK